MQLGGGLRECDFQRLCMNHVITCANVCVGTHDGELRLNVNPSCAVDSWRSTLFLAHYRKVAGGRLEGLWVTGA